MVSSGVSLASLPQGAPLEGSRVQRDSLRKLEEGASRLDLMLQQPQDLQAFPCVPRARLHPACNNTHACASSAADSAAADASLAAAADLERLSGVGRMSLIVSFAADPRGDGESCIYTAPLLLQFVLRPQQLLLQYLQQQLLRNHLQHQQRPVLHDPALPAAFALSSLSLLPPSCCCCSADTLWCCCGELLPPRRSHSSSCAGSDRWSVSGRSSNFPFCSFFRRPLSQLRLQLLSIQQPCRHYYQQEKVEELVAVCSPTGMLWLLRLGQHEAPQLPAEIVAFAQFGVAAGPLEVKARPDGGMLLLRSLDRIIAVRISPTGAARTTSESSSTESETASRNQGDEEAAAAAHAEDTSTTEIQNGAATPATETAQDACQQTKETEATAGAEAVSSLGSSESASDTHEARKRPRQDGAGREPLQDAGSGQSQFQEGEQQIEASREDGEGGRKRRSCPRDACDLPVLSEAVVSLEEAPDGSESAAEKDSGEATEESCEAEEASYPLQLTLQFVQQDRVQREKYTACCFSSSSSTEQPSVAAVSADRGSTTGLYMIDVAAPNAIDAIVLSLETSKLQPFKQMQWGPRSSCGLPAGVYTAAFAAFAAGSGDVTSSSTSSSTLVALEKRQGLLLLLQPKRRRVWDLMHPDFERIEKNVEVVESATEFDAVQPLEERENTPLYKALRRFISHTEPLTGLPPCSPAFALPPVRGPSAAECTASAEQPLLWSCFEPLSAAAAAYAAAATLTDEDGETQLLDLAFSVRVEWLTPTGGNTNGTDHAEAFQESMAVDGSHPTGLAREQPRASTQGSLREQYQQMIRNSRARYAARMAERGTSQPLPQLLQQ
ncbi:hypothetical protein cyc_08055 [Cyclospora cayetanensis]|uniref:Uncharacterized protein n=1 Tax=Cyclospora cayetanensis TaxID=88456 RepID=A0A1D3CVK6_9EIME|nr:hypothetical protein cyc_08055 [Cyclospora cayetanensis]